MLNQRLSVGLFRIMLLLLASALCMPVQLYGQLQIDFRRMLAQLQGQYPQDRLQLIEHWQQQLADLQSKPESEQLLQINAFFHQHIRYATDQELYGVADFWATPAETLALGRGDCEDYAIAKYISLRQLGMADEKLRLIYVRARIGGPYSSATEAHMVLGYYEHPTAEPLILDSLLSQVLPASERPDLSPVFSFNSAGLWAGQGAERASGSPVSRLSRWRSVLERMNQQGIEIK